MNGALENLASVLETALADSVGAIVINFLNLLPSILAAIVIFVVGWIVAVILSKILTKLLELVRLEKFLATHKLEDALGRVRLSNVLVQLTKLFVMLIFLQQAVSFVGLGEITNFLTEVLAFVPVLIGSVLLIVVAALFWEFVKAKVYEFGVRSKMIKTVGKLSKALIIFWAITVALETIGFDMTIISQSFITILQGAVYGVALAVGIAFGLGGQDEAKDALKKVRKKLGV
jgi:hypothetical protein